LSTDAQQKSRLRTSCPEPALIPPSNNLPYRVAPSAGAWAGGAVSPAGVSAAGGVLAGGAVELDESQPAEADRAAATQTKAKNFVIDKTPTKKKVEFACPDRTL
jgi:hypothetical protein